MRLPIALICSTALLALAPAAHAEVRTGLVSDPAGDGTPVDILNATAHYDTNGSATALVQLGGPVTTTPFFLNVMVASYEAPFGCGGVGFSLFGLSTSQDGLTKVDGVAGNGKAYLAAADTTTIGITASDATARGLDLSCVEVLVGDPTTGAPYDTLNVPLFFDGFGPPKCDPPALKGKTLAKAKVIIRKATACSLGEVKQPKHKRKGTTVVVVDAIANDDGTIDLTLKAKSLKPRKHSAADKEFGLDLAVRSRGTPAAKLAQLRSRRATHAQVSV